MTVATQPRIVGASLCEADKQSERAELKFLVCKLDGECPLLAQGKCVQAHTFLGPACVYGSERHERTATKRSKSYYKELNALREKRKPLPGYPDPDLNVGIHVIGDYYYLPYALADMCKQVPFVAHRAVFGGKPFVPKDKFGPEEVVTLARFRPHALFGGEITDYQQNQVPVFLFHLKSRFPELYAAAMALAPELEAKTFSPAVASKPLVCQLRYIPVGLTKGYKVRGRTAANAWLDVEEYVEGKMVLVGKIRDMMLSLGFEGKKDSTARLEFDPDLDDTYVRVTDPDLVVQLVLAHPELATTK